MALTQVQGGMLAGSTNTTTTIQSNGTTAITINSSQNVGIGTTTPSGKLHTFQSGADSTVQFEAGTAGYASNLNLIANTAPGGAFNNITSLSGGSAEWRIGGSGNNNTIVFSTGSGYTERMRITSGGDLCVGKTSTALATVGFGVASDGSTLITKTHADSGGAQLYLNRLNVNGPAVYFYKDTSNVGNISVTGSATSYNSGSDYRLKDNIQPLTNALAKVAQLKPSTWTWKVDNTYGDGFVAHELAEVCPNAVTGEKDAVNEDGSIRPQGVDTSFLVATLTAAIQELNAKVEAQAAEIAALKAK